MAIKDELHRLKNIHNMARTKCNSYYYKLCTIEAHGWNTKASIHTYALNCDLYLTVTAHIQPSTVQRRHYGAVEWPWGSLSVPAVNTLGDSVPFQRATEFAAVRIAPLHSPPFRFLSLQTLEGNYGTVLILMRIATPMRGCQCFPSFSHKEINKNTQREALPYLFWKPRDVTTSCATFASQDGAVLSSQLLCLNLIIIL